MNRFLLAVAVLLFALSVSWQSSLSSAQAPESADPPPLEIWQAGKLPPAEYNSLFHLLPDEGKRTPDLLRHLSPVRQHMRQLLTLVDEVDTIVTNYTRNTANAPLITCNHRNTGWVPQARNFFHHRRLGDVDLSCVTDAYDNSIQNASRQQPGSNPSAYAPDALFRLVNGYSRRLDDVSERLAELAQPPGWEDPGQSARSNSFLFEDRSQMCMHDFVGFAKVNGRWFINTRITYRDPLLTLGQRERLYLNELDGGDIDNFSVQSVTLPKYGSEQVTPPNGTNIDFDIWANDSWVVSNTAFEEQGGAAFASQFGNIFPTDNLAVNLALERGKHSTELAFDATTPSNIAILALPLAMNVVPVALIADVNTFGMLVYTLLTDVLSAIPLAIKGVEVLLIGKRTKYGAVIRISGGNLFEDGDEFQNRAAEIWVAECEPEVDFITSGTSLLVVALFFMVGGVVAEIVAKRWVQRKRQYDMENFIAQQTISQSLLSPQAVALVMSNENARNKRD